MMKLSQNKLKIVILCVITFSATLHSPGLLAQSQTQFWFMMEPYEDTVKYDFYESGFAWDECTLEIIAPPQNADTAFIAENPLDGRPLFV